MVHGVAPPLVQAVIVSSAAAGNSAGTVVLHRYTVVDMASVPLRRVPVLSVHSTSRGMLGPLLT